MSGRESIFDDQSKRKAIQTDLVPLINVVFLLLIFFLVTGNIIQSSDATIENPDAITGDKIKDDALVIRMTYDNKIIVNDTVLSRQQIINLENYLKDSIKGNPSRQILINADARISALKLVQIVNILSKSGLENIAIATRDGVGGDR